MYRSIVLLCGPLLSATLANPPIETVERPNVLFLVVDDLNDWIGCLQGHPQATTPHLDRLAAAGVLFTRAYCQAPICNPSRVSVLTSRHPANTGIYLLTPTDFRAASPPLRDPAAAPTLPEFFAGQGYRTWGCGKIYHGGNRHTFEEYGPAAAPGPFPRRKLSSVGGGRLWDWGRFPPEDERQGDVKIADWAIARLGRPVRQPFFLAVGFFRPHVPLYAGSAWWDAVGSAETIAIPRTLPHDRRDLGDFAQRLTWSGQAPRHAWFEQHGKWRQAVHAYLACVRFVDHQVGRVLRALREGPHAKSTVVVLWSDHGFALGEKARWAKRGLWERETHVPLIFAGPGIAQGESCDQPVGLIDLFPTLAEICRLPRPAGLEGHSLARQLQGRPAPRPPVLTTFYRGNHALRSRRWRYIRYADGSEELYDHASDPLEWHNLAHDPGRRHVMRELARHLPVVDAAPVPGSRGLGVRPEDRGRFGAE